MIKIQNKIKWFCKKCKKWHQDYPPLNCPNKNIIKNESNIFNKCNKCDYHPLSLQDSVKHDIEGCKRNKKLKIIKGDINVYEKTRK